MRTWIAAAGAAWTLAALGVHAVEVINGNSYTAERKHLEYSFGKPGSYREVTSMNKETGKCESRNKDYSGPLGQFAEELSLHVRGPCQLDKVAVLVPNRKGKEGGKAKRDVAPPHQHQHQHQRRHGHHHFHARDHEIRAMQKRAECDVVTATIDGKVQTWTNSYNCGGGGGAAAATSTATPSTSPSPAPNAPSEERKPGGDGTGQSQSQSQSQSSRTVDTSKLTGDWVRIAYYDAASQTAEGLVFLGNHGGQDSGVFDNTYGLSLSYAAGNALKGASGPQILEKDLTIPSNKEVIIFSDRKCENGDCGFVRPGAVAYHGFDGEEKAFVFRFKMPDDGTSGDIYTNPNMPAIWLLNAKIPRTGQYVKDSSCSCWKSGCGEFDLFEVLDPGNKRCKSMVHSNDSFGHPEWFARPVDKFITAAVVFTNGKGHIKVLEDGYDFGANLSIEDLKKMM